jgi:hypothetical protein
MSLFSRRIVINVEYRFVVVVDNLHVSTESRRDDA